MVGASIIPADVSTLNKGSQGENTTTVNLPAAVWFNFNSTAAVLGNRTIVHDNVALIDFPVYVRPGTVLPLQTGDIQYSDNMGGTLEVQVYAGSDGKFTLTEDDGYTLDYVQDYTFHTRATTFQWDDAAKTLTWKRTGGYNTGDNLYTKVFATLFMANATSAQRYRPLYLGMWSVVSATFVCICAALCAATS